MTLDQLGWSPYWESLFASVAAPSWKPARVMAQHHHIYCLAGDDWEADGEVAGRFRHAAATPADFPAVGDWVAIASGDNNGTSAVIHAVLPRRTQFTRRMAGPRPVQQVVASNVDVVFLVAGLDHDFNLRRLERYLALAWESGAKPTIILNKADLCDDADRRLTEVEGIALGVAVHTVSAVTKVGLDYIATCVGRGLTAALLGSSGVGKSTIVNALLGAARQDVSEVREDDSRGRHTTTHRELIPLPSGGILMDTPGMRELQLWGDGEGMDHAFQDVASLGASCRYRDCTHTNEPGCAVIAAVERGDLPDERYGSYRKLQREYAYLRRKEDRREQQKETNRWKQIHKEAKRLRRTREKGGRYE